jgi:valyl-tRNA synthetase
METGYDILFFWVARMIMSGLEYTGQAPFHTVYLHGLIRDEHGQKMSKTKGNVIDPLTVMDELGTDALRFTLLVGSTPGNDMNLSVKKVEANRNFANKIWNAGRFVIHVIDSLDDGPRTGERAIVHGQPSTVNWTLADSWIWAKAQQLVRDVERLFQTFQYGEAGRQIYEFFWSDFADWYVEIAKEQMKKDDTRYSTVVMLARVFDLCLRLLHPFTPFVTEEVWGHLRRAMIESPISNIALDWPEALIVAGWPEPQETIEREESLLTDFALIQDLVRSIRNLRAEKSVPPSRRIAALVAAGEKTKILQSQKQVVAALAGLDEAQFAIQEGLSGKPKDSIALVIGTIEVYVPLAGMVDLANEESRLKKELKEAEAQIERLEKLLSGDFANKAPAPVVDKERERLAGFKETAEKLIAQLKT